MCAAMRATARALGRTLAGGVIVAAAPVRVRDHRLAADLVKGDVLRGMARRGRDRDRREHAFGKVAGPLQHLHAAHRAASHGEQRIDSQVVDQAGLRAHHVADRHHRKRQSVGLAGSRVGAGRSGGAHASAQDVGADDEESLGVDRAPRPDEPVPPARLPRYRVDACRVLVPGQGMAQQHRVAAVLVERAVGLVGDLPGRELDTAVEPQRRILAEAHDKARGRIGLVARRGLSCPGSGGALRHARLGVGTRQGVCFPLLRTMVEGR